MPKNIACPVVPRVTDPITDQEADLSRLPRRAVEGLPKLNIGRDQILDRLWELATLSHEATRGSIAGQMKALAMIVAIEGLIPPGTMKGPRLSLTQNQHAAPPATAEIDTSEPRRPWQHQAEGTEPGGVVAATEVQAAGPRPPEQKRPPQPAPKPQTNASSSHLDRNHSSVINPFIHHPKPTWVSGDAESIFEAALEATNALRLPYCAEIGIASRRY